MTEPKDLERLERRLKAARSEQQTQKDQRSGSSRPKSSGMGFGFRLAMDLVAALLLGVGVGIGLDWWLGTKPLFMIVFFFLGGAAGFLNVYRAASGQGFAVGYKPRKPSEKDDEPG